MSNYIDLIKNFNKEDYENSVNLHLHTNFSDGKHSPEEMILSAKQKGLKHISITDHNTIDAYLKTDILKEECIIPGIEFDCWEGSIFLHLLGYGIDIHNKELQSVCAKTKKETEADIVRIFSKLKARDLIKIIHNAGGIAVIAHPACCWAFNHKKFVEKMINFNLDGLEVYYPYLRHRGIIKFTTAKKIENIANELDLIKTGGTDCHDLL